MSYFAVLAAGGTPVNCNPLMAPVELVRQMEDSEAEIIITVDVAELYEKAAGALGATRGQAHCDLDLDQRQRRAVPAKYLAWIPSLTERRNLAAQRSATIRPKWIVRRAMFNLLLA